MIFQGGLFFIGLILSVILTILTFLAFWKGRLGIRSFVLWILLSLGLAVFSLFPDLIDLLARLLSVQVRGLFVLTTGLLIAYALIYASYVSQRTIEKTVQRLNQEISLLHYRLEYNIDEGTHGDSGDYRRAE